MLLVRVIRVVGTLVGVLAVVYHLYWGGTTRRGPDIHLAINHNVIEVLNPTEPFTLTVSGFNRDEVKRVSRDLFVRDIPVEPETGVDEWGNPTTLYQTPPIRFQSKIYTDSRNVFFRIQGDEDMQVSVHHRFHGLEAFFALMLLAISMLTAVELISESFD